MAPENDENRIKSFFDEIVEVFLPYAPFQYEISTFQI